MSRATDLDRDSVESNPAKAMGTGFAVKRVQSPPVGWSLVASNESACWMAIRSDAEKFTVNPRFHPSLLIGGEGEELWRQLDVHRSLRNSLW